MATRGPCKFQQLPQALVMDIFLRLVSVKTLLRCRCVCKEWLSVISEPQFAHLHLLRLQVGILVKTEPPIKRSRKLHFTQIEECGAGSKSKFQVEKIRFTPKTNLPNFEYCLINSCNGLLCLSGAERDDPLYVCNPILGEFIAIPPTRKRRRWSSFIGLGFSAATNEYKVLQTCSSAYNIWAEEAEAEAEIYTIGTGVWRSIGNVPKDRVRLPFDAFLHGHLHFVTENPISYEVSLYSFNFEREQFRTLPPPPSHNGDEFQLYRAKKFKLGQLGGRLLLSIFYDNSMKFDMWVMEEYGVQETWTKILVTENLFSTRLGRDWYEPIMFLSNGEILLWYITQYDRAVVCYNQETKCLAQTKIARTQPLDYATAFTPSFVSLYYVSKGEEVKRVGGSKKSGTVCRRKS